MDNMQLSISDAMISDFLSGLVAVLALVAVGGGISLVLQGMARRFPFSRLALILALAPLSMVRFLERGGTSTLYLYAMIVVLMGLTIDGIGYLLQPKEAPKAKPAKGTEEEAASEESEPGVIVWEKAE